MATLHFYYGLMSAGKSTTALQLDFTLKSSGKTGCLLTKLGRKEGAISSRLGHSQPAIELEESLPHSLIDPAALDYLIVDEVQFLTTAQIDDLSYLVDHFDLDVYAFGLLSDFTGTLFPSVARLFAFADECEELQLRPRCFCGRKAVLNARITNGVVVYQGETVVQGDVTPDAVTYYEVLCRAHYNQGYHSQHRP